MLELPSTISQDQIVYISSQLCIIVVVAYTYLWYNSLHHEYWETAKIRVLFFLTELVVCFSLSPPHTHIDYVLSTKENICPITLKNNHLKRFSQSKINPKYFPAKGHD